ncbi:MAG: hypothetical protein WB500_14510 [Rhodoplanes sp.]
MPDPENMTLLLLREMRGRMEDRFDRVDQKLITHDARFEALEKKIDDVKKAAFGESLVGRYMAAEVEERLAAIEARLAALENRS